MLKLPHNCTLLTCQQSNTQNSPSQVSTVHESRSSNVQAGFRKSEEPEIKWPTSAGSLKKQESSRKTFTFALLTMSKPLTMWITTNCGKFFKKWETRLPYLPPEKPYAGQEVTIRTGHGTTDQFQIEKEGSQVCILSPCLFNLYAEHIMQNAGLVETQAGTKIAGRNINNLGYRDDTTLMAESEDSRAS